MGIPYSSERGTEAWKAFKTQEKKKTITYKYPDLSDAFVMESRESRETYIERIDRVMDAIKRMEMRNEKISLGNVYILLKKQGQST